MLCVTLESLAILCFPKAVIIVHITRYLLFNSWIIGNCDVRAQSTYFCRKVLPSCLLLELYIGLPYKSVSVKALESFKERLLYKRQLNQNDNYTKIEIRTFNNESSSWCPNPFISPLILLKAFEYLPLMIFQPFSVETMNG